MPSWWVASFTGALSLCRSDPATGEGAKHSDATQAVNRSIPTASTSPWVCEAWHSRASTLRLSASPSRPRSMTSSSGAQMRGQPSSYTPKSLVSASSTQRAFSVATACST